MAPENDWHSGYACVCGLVFLACEIAEFGERLPIFSRLFCRRSAGRPQTLDKIRLRECNSSGSATIGDRLIGDLLAKRPLAATKILSRLLYAIEAGRAMSATLGAMLRVFQSATAALS
jgi:hypothetical protein